MVVSRSSNSIGLVMKSKAPPVHRRPDVPHIAIGRDDDGLEVAVQLVQPLQEREPVHPRHVDVGQDDVDMSGSWASTSLAHACRPGRKTNSISPLRTLRRKLCAISALDVRLVVHHQDARRSHAATPIARARSSLRLGESRWAWQKKLDGALRLSPLTLRRRVAVGRDHEHADPRPRLADPPASSSMPDMPGMLMSESRARISGGVPSRRISSASCPDWAKSNS